MIYQYTSELFNPYRIMRARFKEHVLEKTRECQGNDLAVTSCTADRSLKATSGAKSPTAFLTLSLKASGCVSGGGDRTDRVLLLAQESRF